MNRRRFLQITAASLALPGAAQAETLWRGTALGAQAELRLTGPVARAEAASQDIPALLQRAEETFSLYRPSELTRLNASGSLSPSRWFQQVVDLSDALYHATNGAFDPSIQSLWQALATGQTNPVPTGWSHVRIGRQITLVPGQALTFNGIAQGFATDLIRTHLSRHGFDHALINIGEYAALGGPFRLGISDPVAGLLAEWRVSDGALAASSPHGTLVAGQPHILHPRGQAPLWSTVAVQASTAALADGLSTALVFLSKARIRALFPVFPGLHRVALVDAAGNLETLQAALTEPDG